VIFQGKKKKKMNKRRAEALIFIEELSKPNAKKRKLKHVTKQAACESREQLVHKHSNLTL